jgi:hypothetical protein
MRVLPVMSAARMPTLSLPRTTTLPLFVNVPARRLSSAIPALVLPSMVIVPELATLPVNVPPGAMRMP